MNTLQRLQFLMFGPRSLKLASLWVRVWVGVLLAVLNANVAFGADGASGETPAGTTAALSVGFADANLSRCVSKAVKKAGGISPANLTALTCNAMGIQDATGIAQLTRLTRLSLFGNHLSAIDVSTLTELETLNLANNKLERIELNGNSALTTLYLFGNQLQHLDLQALPMLSKVKAEKNLLLDVWFPAESALTKVYLFNNEMVDIKIDSLSSLKFIDVRSNPMPDEVYDYLDTFSGVKASHDGNTEDWK